MNRLKITLIAALSLMATSITAQEYHGEMERIYPYQPTTEKKPTTTAAPKTNKQNQIPIVENPSTLLPYLQQLGTELLRGKTGSIVAEDPATGEILCLVTNSPSSPYDNLAIATAYAPGSTFKVAQALTLLSEGIVTTKSKIGCLGEYNDGTLKVGCHKHGSPLQIPNALAFSCNTWFLKAFTLMVSNNRKYGSKENAIDVWRDYMVSMGLGGPTGIDLPGEKGGLVANSSYLSRRYPSGWTPRTIIWAGMGQGDITATPLQLCNLAATVANRGWYYPPHVHRGTAEQPLHPRYTTRKETKVAPVAYSPVVNGMRAAVQRGTAAGINTPAYSICGKTGTVENKGKDHSVFIGFAPMYSPKIAISVFIENGGFGADVAAPIAAKIIKAYMGRQGDERTRR